MQNTAPNIMEVSAGIFLKKDKALLTKRLSSQPWPGYWEFPGGKLEQGETLQGCLKREIFEEIGVVITAFSRWITREFKQDNKTIKITFFKITKWDGEIQNKEVEDHLWIDLSSKHYPDKMLPKNLYIVRALKLPPFYLISNFYENNNFFINNSVFEEDFMIQLREPCLSEYLLKKLYKKLKVDFKKNILVNSRHVNFLSQKNGIHYTENDLKNIKSIDKKIINSASVHNIAGLKKAESIGLDFVVLSPVLKTRSHPKAKPMGWRIFKEMANQSSIPVYPLGGLTVSDLNTSLDCGGVGIGSQRSIWPLLNSK